MITQMALENLHKKQVTLMWLGRYRCNRPHPPELALEHFSATAAAEVSDGSRVLRSLTT